jgi:3-phenylpropionate/trans-cinnamate dioxygenase ferredoxin reductase subunit
LSSVPDKASRVAISGLAGERVYGDRMSDSDRIVIVGAGLAGARTAEVLRDDGFEGEIVLLGAERRLPYNRPPLSKGFLVGETPEDEVTVHPAEWYSEQNIDLRLATTVSAIEAAEHQVVVDDGTRLRYAKLVLATGSAPRRLDLPGNTLEGVVYLRTWEDCLRLKEALAQVADGTLTDVATIGGGWIGLETAAAFRQAGANVTVLEAGGLPLSALLGPTAAQPFTDLHREHGVDIRTGVKVTGLAATGDSQQVSAVLLEGGATVPAGLVLVGIGAIPNTGLAEGAGLTVSNGVVTDGQGRTSDPDIFAVGDISRHHNASVREQVRVEHWANALNQPLSVSRGLLGREGDDEKPPYFFTDQYDLGMEYAGYNRADDDVVIRGDLSSREFVAFWLREGRLVAGMNVNVWDVNEDIQQLVTDRTPVDATKLADPHVPISEATSA